MSRPNPNEHPAYFTTYIDKVSGDDFLPHLEQNLNSTPAFFQTLPVEKLKFRYAEGKWDLLEIILHMIDSERVFAYRALRFARRDATELPGFDENLYAYNGHATSRSLESLLQEYVAVRNSSIHLFRSFGSEELMCSGIANGKPISVRALGFIMAGHEAHHLQIIRERYL